MTETCPARHHRADATYDCDQPAKHIGVHRCQINPNEYVTWPNHLSVTDRDQYQAAATTTVGAFLAATGYTPAERRKLATPGIDPAAITMRRNTVTHILDRLARGRALAPDEAALLRSHHNAEVAEGDAARRQAAEYSAGAEKAWERCGYLDEQAQEQARRLTKARRQRNEAREAFRAAERTLNVVRDAKTWHNVIAALAPHYGWTDTEVDHIAQERITGVVRTLQQQHDKARQYATSLETERDTARDELVKARTERDKLREKLNTPMFGVDFGFSSPLLAASSHGDIAQYNRLSAAYESLLGRWQGTEQKLLKAVRDRQAAEERARDNLAAQHEAEAGLDRIKADYEELLGNWRETAKQMAGVRTARLCQDCRVNIAAAVDAQQSAAATARMDNTEATLTPFTVPVSPREMRNVSEQHPVHELIDAIVNHRQHSRDSARELISRYYDTVTSAPPANPNERPVTVSIGGTLTGEQMQDALRTLARTDRQWFDAQIRRYNRMHRGIADPPARFPVNLFGIR